MYWVVDAGCYFSCLTLIIYALAVGQWYTACFALAVVWVYPLVLQMGFNLLSICLTRPTNYTIKSASRFVYHPDYNISLGGFEKQHPFDAQKYARIFQQLIARRLVNPKEIAVPNKLSRRFLLEKMSWSYLLSLSYSFRICRIIQLPLWLVPSWYLRWRVLNPMLLASEGSILASCLAKVHGWAVNLSGGFHHASWDKGEGFCIYPDISLVVHYLQTRMKIGRIMIIDLDAHQGNGYEKDLVLQENVYIVDCYNHRIYPKDSEVKEAIGKNLPIQHSTSNEEYLKLVSEIEQDFDYFRPEFVIYNAGTDILADDPLGKLQISKETVIERDANVIGMCRSRGIPVVMLLSGGYQPTNASIIADSLANLLQKYQ